MSTPVERGDLRTLREDAAAAVVWFGCAMVLVRLDAGAWSVGRPLVFAVLMAIGGPILQAFASRGTKARWAARRAAEPIHRRLRRERGVLVGVLVATVAALLGGVVLVGHDLDAERGFVPTAGLVIVLLTVSVVALVRGIVARTRTLGSVTSPAPEQQ